MAKIGRTQLVGSSNSNFPTNNAKRIKAVNHRLHNDDMIDSKFNWVDDEIKNVWWDVGNNITLEDHLNSRGVIMRGSTYVQNIGDQGGSLIGPILSTGEIISASKINYGVTSSININFNDLVISDYMVLLNIRTIGTVSIDSSLLHWVIGAKTSTSFSIAASDSSTDFQYVWFDIALIK